MLHRSWFVALRQAKHARVAPGYLTIIALKMNSIMSKALSAALKIFLMMAVLLQSAAVNAEEATTTEITSFPYTATAIASYKDITLSTSARKLGNM